MSEEQPLTAMVFFEVRNDKDRGNLVLTIRKEGNADVHFFRFHHQPVKHHPEQIQQIIQQSKPSARTKSIKVDIISFGRQYWSGTDFEFKGVKLNSTKKQASTVYNRLINKEVGLLKRKKTVEETKQKKIKEKNGKMTRKFQEEESAFQIERARRIASAMNE
ncbi:hypothetical protein HA402_008048 [Bradysia odoriphaga]|nr:hypothetical protein HA402_008048 [Bradysia odoriphaga]